MTELTDDEFAVLEIASAGNSMIAIGRWQKPIEHLVELGLMRSVNKANNYITDAGKVALEKHANVVDDAFVRAAIGVHNHQVLAKLAGPHNVNGKLFFQMIDGSSISCDCIAEPYVSQIVEMWNRR